MAKGYKHSPEAIEKIRQARLGKKQTPETIAARNAWRKETVRVSRNDAAMLEIARQYFEIGRQIGEIDDPYGDDSGLVGLCTRTNLLTGLAYAWLDGEEILIAKLAQQ